MRVLIVDDHPILRAGLAGMLKPDPRFTEIVQCSSLADAVAAAESGEGGLFIVDLTLPDARMVEAVEHLHQVVPEALILVFAADVSRQTVESAFAAGARGFVPKGAPASTLIAAIDVVLCGEVFVPKEVLPTWSSSAAEAAKAAPSPVRLTPRQQDVLLGLAGGLANKEIAVQLGMSHSTVRVHVSAIFRALSVENRTQAAMHPKAQALLAERAFGVDS
ncbi:MAG: LuxR C-terminal-related transcriptional regulator [Polyangiales bacterium]